MMGVSGKNFTYLGDGGHPGTPAQRGLDQDLFMRVKIADVEVALRSLSQCLRANSSSR